MYQLLTNCKESSCFYYKILLQNVFIVFSLEYQCGLVTGFSEGKHSDIMCSLGTTLPGLSYSKLSDSD